MPAAFFVEETAYSMNAQGARTQEQGATAPRKKRATILRLYLAIFNQSYPFTKVISAISGSMPTRPG